MPLTTSSVRLARSARGAGGSLLLLAALSGVAPPPASAQTPTTTSWREEILRLRPGLAPGGRRAARGVASAATATSATIIAETEPNNAVETADSAALGVQVTGALDPANDPDVWFLDLTAGQYVSIDVDAQSIGSQLDPALVLLGPDGRTEVAFNHDFDGLDSRISYRVTASGRYFVLLPALGGVGGPDFNYVVTFGIITCGVDGTEQEPNDAPAAASPAAVGTSVSGDICSQDVRPGGDVDYWAFQGQAGTTIELDLDAADPGRLVDPVIALYASDGTTRLSFDHDGIGFDPRMRTSLTATGTYYVSVARVSSNGQGSDNPFPYTLHLRAIPPGPGDPTSVRAERIGFPLGIAVGATGDVFVADVDGSRVLRVSDQGPVTTFGPPIVGPVGLAFDAFGALLVVSLDGNVYRLTPQGQATLFITDAPSPLWIAVAPDGRIWLTDGHELSLRRYSATGEFETKFDATAAGGLGPGPLAFGPSGEPYLSSGSDIWKLADGALRRVFTYDAVIWALAFDVAGNIYASSLSTDRVVVFDPAGTPLVDPFVAAVHEPLAVAFGRDASGATVARFFAAESELGRIVEVNPAGVARPGLPVGVRTLTAEVAAQALLGAGALSPADAQYLDALGNHNGRYDVGDLQAFLRLVGELPGAAASRPRQGSER